jgi:N-methylhydantoinase B
MTTHLDFDPIRLEIYKHLFASIAEEMGVVLRKSSYSPNIKERLDFSCAVFDPVGNMVSQAAHIPVHLGSMPLSVAAAIHKFSQEITEGETIQPGDVLILNDPYRGGTHLPDVTLISPVFLDDEATNPVHIGFVASRAHHADVGGAAPGSMFIAREIYQEGLILPPVKLIANGKMNSGILDIILANVRTPEERLGDLWAQIAANRRGAARFRDITLHKGLSETQFYMHALLDYSERMTRRLLESLPDGTYAFTDHLDDDGIQKEPITIHVQITIHGDEAEVDFSGSASQVAGSLNAVYAITLSAVNYVFRCLVGLDVPNNSGCLTPIKVIAPEGLVVNALHPAPVAGGNVETSQRIVDVLLGAMAQACPELIPAASQGTMNNITIGGTNLETGSPFTYYETVGGGMGGRPKSDGPSALHSHMTNTLNTPCEALEYAYPLTVLRYEIRRGSGGGGQFKGGNGIRRDIRIDAPAQLSLITERRITSPYGLHGGEPGEKGENLLIRGSEVIHLPGKGTISVHPGDILSIRTPGGGGYGKEPSPGG